MSKDKGKPGLAIALTVPETLTKRSLSKSRFKIGAECPAKLFYLNKPEYPDKKSTDSFLEALAEGGHQVGALAKLHFPHGIEIEEKDPLKAVAATRLALAQPSITLFEAAFTYENLLVRADVLEKEGDTYRLYEVKAKSYDDDQDAFLTKSGITSDWREYLWDLSFQTFVVSNALKTKRIVPYLMLLNKKARTTVDGLGNKFLLQKDKNDRVTVVTHKSLTTETMGARLLIAKDCTTPVEIILSGKDKNDWRGTDTFGTWVSKLSAAYALDRQAPISLGSQCKQCEYRIDQKDYPGKKSGFDKCWKKALNLKESDLLRPRVFDVWDFRKSDVLITDGTYFLDELTEEDLSMKPADEPGLSRTERQWLQIETYKKGETAPTFLREEFEEATKDLKAPYHFIDFETSRPAIPFTRGRRPYEQVAFQFSHHVMYEDGTIEHKSEYIDVAPGKFPNFDFVRELKKSLGNEGTIFRYSHHENSVLRDILFQLEAVTDEEVPERKDLINWLKTIVVPEDAKEIVKKGNPLPWTPTRPMVDLCELVKRFYFHPLMKNSNSIKVVLPAVLNSSKYLQEKYSKPIYGTRDGIKSKNYKEKTWVQRKPHGQIADPYELLDPIFPDYDREQVNRLFFGEELDDGGAATVAYSRLQFTEMSETERTHLIRALLRYCELDTLAMVLIWEAWRN